MLKGEILTVLKRETKKAAKLAEAKKTKNRAVKAASKKTPASGGKSTTKKPVKAEKSKNTAQSKSTKSAAPVKKTITTKKTIPKQKSKTTSAKAKTQKTLSKSVPKQKSKRPALRKKPISRSISPSSSEYQDKEGYDVQALHPKFALDDIAQEAKFIVGKPDLRDESQAELSPELPSGYGDNKIVMLVRDPHWCFLYWELQEDHIQDGLRRLSRSQSEVRHVLRVYPASGKEAPFDVDVDFRHDSHYLQLSSGTSFYAEIGLLNHAGDFVALAVSNTIALPLEGPSDIVDEKWITTDENFEEIYILSGGEVTELGQTNKEFMQEGFTLLPNARLKQSRIGSNFSSSGVGSFGSAEIQQSPPETNFSYWLNAELILYGGADLGSTIKLSGKKLDLRPDGTFTVRFGLPDGELKLPVTFVSPDHSETHTITPNVIRHTESKTGGSDQ